MPFYDDGTSLPAESALSPDEVAEILKQRKAKEQAQQQQKQQQAASPSSKGGSEKPKPEKAGPQDPAGMNPVQKFFEEKIAIPATDFIDNTFQGDQKTPDQIAKERAGQRAEYSSSMEQVQRNLDSRSMVEGEVVRGVAGGAEDLFEGLTNLPGQASNALLGTDYKPVNFGLVRENSSTAGQGLRTISRYVMGSMAVGAGLGAAGISMTAGRTGVGLFGARAAQGFMEDFASADGTAEDNTLIGQTPFTQFLQTSDRNDPLVNRTIVGIEGALFEAAGLPAVKALARVSGVGQAARKLGQISDGYFKAKGIEKMNALMDKVSKELGVDLKPVTTESQITDLLEQTRQMLSDPKVLQNQRKLRLVAEYNKALREAAAPRLAIEAQQRLKKLLANEFAQDNFGSTLDYTKVTERDLAIRLIKEDPQRLKLNTLIAEAAGTADETDHIFDYLRQRVDAFQASKELDDIVDTVQYGGKPDERVFDVTRLPEIEDGLAQVDGQINEISATLGQADEALATSDSLFKQNAQLGGEINKEIAVLQSQLEQLPTEADAVAAQSIKLSLSKAQVARLQGIQLPEGVTITPGRRVQGLTADNIDEVRAAVAEAAASGDKVAANLSARLDNIEVPAKQDFRTREAVAQQIEELKAKRQDLFGGMVEQRQQHYQAKAERGGQLARLEDLQVRRDAVAAKLSGNEEQFAADYIPVNMTRQNVTSIVKERAGGQPGMDLYFEDKRFPALLDGRVKEIGRQGSGNSGYGNYIVVESIDPKTGQTVDVLYAHLEDGSVKVKEGDLVGRGQQIAKQGGTGRVVSQDGTIASVDFLAPAPKGSKSMTPYSRWSELVDDISLAIHKGELTPSQVGRKAPSVAPEVVADAARQADEYVTTFTRKEAVEQGYEVDQVAPVQPRTSLVEDFQKPLDEVYTGTAKPAAASLTDADVQSFVVGGAQGMAKMENLVSQIEKQGGFTELDFINVAEDAKALAKEVFEADDDGFMQLLEDPRIVGKVDGHPIFTNEGLIVNGLVLRELQRQMLELSDGVLRHMEDGAPQARHDAVRYVDRTMAYLKLRTDAKEATSGALRAYDYSARNMDAIEGGGRGADSKVMQKLLADQQDKIAKEQNMYQAFAQLRQRLIAGDPKAFRELQRTAKAMSVAVPTAKNFRGLQTALAGVGKDLDALYVNSILSGPVTQTRNFWGNFYQTIGHPVQALLGASLPGAENAVVRRQAVAAIGATFETNKEFVDLFTRLYKKNWESAADAKEYVIWDENLSRNMAELQDKIEKGEVDFLTSTVYSAAINLRKIVDSPFMRPMMSVMGAADGYFKVMAARQVAARRAVEMALDELGDAPLTGLRAEKFGQLVAEFKEHNLKQIMDPDGITVVDPEAIQLGESFTFQTPFDESNTLGRGLAKLAEIPGGKFLGLTFIKTPSNILKSSANLTPGLSRFLKLRDEAYKNGDAYYRSMRDGAEAMSYVIGGLAFLGGTTGTMTGAGPLRGPERELWLQNHKPFTITLGGFEFNYQGLEPAATVLGTFADLGAVGREDSAEHGFLHSIMAIAMAAPAVTASNVINKSYLAQLSTLSQVVTSDPSELGKVAENWAKGLIPYSGARTQWGQILDGGVREVRSQIEPTWSWYMKKHAGLGASMTAAQQVDPLNGKPLTRDGIDGPGHTISALAQLAGMGLRVSKERFRKVHRLLEEVGYDIPAKTRELMGEKLTNEEMVEYVKLRAGDGAFEQQLMDYFNSDQYRLIDKPNTQRQLREGAEPTKTDAYLAVDAIYQERHGEAVGIMEQGLTAPSQSYALRRQAALNKNAHIEQLNNAHSRNVKQQSVQQIVNDFNY